MGTIDEKWQMLGPQTTLAQLIAVAATALAEHGLNAFEFDVPGMTGAGERITLHFECRLEKIGTA